MASYPQLRIEISLWNGSEYVIQQHVAIEEGQHKISIYYTPEENSDEVLLDPTEEGENLLVSSLDNNASVLYRDEDYVLMPKQEGSCTISVYYIHESVFCSTKTEFVIYGNFFKQNYTNLLSQWDKEVILSNTYTKILFDTCMEYFDILWAYQNDVLFVRDPINIKYKFLNTLGTSLGLGSFQFKSDKEEELVSLRLYRELLNNLLDLLKIRGTKLAFELFFGALGYDISLLEYWFDENGDLIEINPYDDSSSTFYAVNTLGIQLEDVPFAHSDPRRNLDPNGVYNYCQKSPYIKPVFSYKEEFSGLISFSLEQQTILREYLEWLRPNHIIYLNEVTKISLPQSGSDIIAQLLDVDESDNPLFSVYELYRPYVYWDGGSLIIDERPYYVNKYGIASRLEAHYDEEVYDLIGNLLAGDPGSFNYAGETQHGTWRGSSGGMVVEDLKDLLETVVVSYPLFIYDILRTLPKYDQGLYYDGYSMSQGQLNPEQPDPDLEDHYPPELWDDVWGLSLPSGNSLFYDVGIMLDEDFPIVIEVTGNQSITGRRSFNESYNYYKDLGYTSGQIKGELMTFYAISSIQYEYLLSLII